MDNANSEILKGIVIIFFLKKNCRGDPHSEGIVIITREINMYIPRLSFH